MILGNIEGYIPIAFTDLKKEDVVRRMFAMVSRFVLQPEDIIHIAGRVIDGLYQIPARGD